MADLAPTDTLVVPDADYKANLFIAGEAVTAGMPVYRLSSDGKAYKAECDNAAKDEVVGITLNNAAINQPVYVMYEGDLTIGDTVVFGMLYVLSAALGKICPVADLVSTNYLTTLFFAISTTKVRLMLKTTAIQKP